MKNVLFALAALAVLGHAQTQTARGRAQVICAQLKNSYGQGDTNLVSTRKSNAPWKFKVDTVFVDTDGSGHYKAIGAGVAGAGDTTKSVAMRNYSVNPMGYLGLSGYRQSANDSGAFSIKPLCWSGITKGWITSRNMQFDPYNSGGDTLLAVPNDSASFGLERYIPSYCDSAKFVLIVKNTTGRSTDATKQTSLFRMGVCAY